MLNTLRHSTDVMIKFQKHEKYFGKIVWTRLKTQLHSNTLYRITSSRMLYNHQLLFNYEVHRLFSLFSFVHCSNSGWPIQMKCHCLLSFVMVLLSYFMWSEVTSIQISHRQFPNAVFFSYPKAFISYGICTVMSCYYINNNLYLTNYKLQLTNTWKM